MAQRDKFHDRFDYENAERDILDVGGDPDYLSYRDPEKRDRYMKKMGLNPKKYGSKWESGSTGNSGGSGGTDDGCYLTTACVRAAGLPDDCAELTALREFRDRYMRQLPGGKEEIREYYRIAPEIVRAVNAGADADAVWKRIYRGLILPCLDRIRCGEPEKAHRMYRDCALELKRRYLGE